MIATVLAIAASLQYGAVSTRIDGFLRSAMAENHIPGLAVAVINRGNVVFERGYGSANIEASSIVTPDTVFELQSVGKQFTAAAVMLLAEERKVNLDTPAFQYLRDLPVAWQKVTVRQLLTHTSGIVEYTSAPGWSATIRLDRTPEQLMQPLRETPLSFPPGSQWRYSNTDYILLGQLIENVTKKPLKTFLAERIFNPLKMSSTRLADLLEIVPNRASGYHFTGKAIVNVPQVSPSQKWAAGGVISNVKDLVLWDNALNSERLLKSSSIAEMIRPAVLADGTECPYGIGNELDHDHGHLVAGHQGSGLGFNACLLRFVKDHLTIVVLTNLTQGRSIQIAHSIALILIPELSDAGKKEVADDDPSLSSKLKSVLNDAATGKANSADFSESGRKQLIPFIERAGPQMLGTLGKLNSLALIESTANGSGKVRRYRAVYATKTVVWTFTLDRQGKIVGMEPQMQ